MLHSNDPFLDAMFFLDNYSELLNHVIFFQTNITNVFLTKFFQFFWPKSVVSCFGFFIYKNASKIGRSGLKSNRI